jgi:transposase-like protein
MSVVPARKRRSYAAEYKVEAAHRVIDSDRSIAEVARELGIEGALLARRSPPRLSRWRVVLPEDASIGLTPPHRAAKAAKTVLTSAGNGLRL